MKHYTTIEQSKKLLKLGLSPDTADMVYFKFLVSTPNSKDWEWGNLPMILGDIPREEIPEETLPCWSLGALLEMVPLPVLFMEITGGCVTWVCEAHKLDGKVIHAKVGIDIIEVVYNIMIWLLENNYIKK